MQNSKEIEERKRKKYNWRLEKILFSKSLICLAYKKMIEKMTWLVCKYLYGEKMKSNKGLFNLLEKHITKSNSWKPEQKMFKWGREEGDYSNPDLSIWRLVPFYNQTRVVELNVLARSDT